MQISEERKQNKETLFCFATFAGVVLIIGAIITGFVSRVSAVGKYNTLFIGACAFVLIAGLVYAYFCKNSIFSTPQKLVALCILFMLPGLLLFLTEDYINFPIWLLGGILVALLVDVNMGMFISYFYILQSVHLQNNTMKGTIILVILAAILCLSVKRLNSLLSVLYIIVSVSCVTLLVSLLLNRVFENDSTDTIAFNLIITCIILISVSYFSKKFAGDVFENNVEINTVNTGSDTDSANSFRYLNEVAEATNEVNYKKTPEEPLPDNAVNNMQPTVVNSEAENNPSEGERISSELEQAINELPQYDDNVKDYCSENSELLLKLKETKRTSYLHSLRVSRLAVSCAQNISNVDPDLVRAAALYHEIGKLRAGDVYSNTIDIAVEEYFPDRLVDCLRGCAKHNTNGVYSGEAAIIIIADTVVTTYYYLKSNNSAIYPEKLVDSVIGKEITQGHLNSSGLSLKDCNAIREFFVEAINKLEKK